MNLTRRTLLGTAAGAATAAIPAMRSRAQTRPVVRIGVMNDQSGPYRDVNGPTGVICAKQAVQEFGAGASVVQFGRFENLFQLVHDGGCCHLPRILGPAMVIVERDVFGFRSVHDRSLAQILWCSKLPHRYPCRDRPGTA